MVLSYWLAPVVVPLSYWLAPAGLLDVDNGPSFAVRLPPKGLPMLMVSELADPARSQGRWFPYWHLQCERDHQIVRSRT